MRRALPGACAARGAKAAPELPDGQPAAAPSEPRPAWPATAVEQLGAIAALLGTKPLSAAEVAARFTGARRDLVERHLETLALMGEIVADADGRYQAARKAA